MDITKTVVKETSRAFF